MFKDDFNAKKLNFSIKKEEKKGKTLMVFASFFLALFLVLTLITPPIKANAAYELPADTSLYADGAYLISLGTKPEDDSVIYEKNASTKYRTAALVHVMVGLTAVKLADEKGIDLNTTSVEYTLELFNITSGSGISTANMEIGEKWLLIDLLNLSLIRTSGDAIVTLATFLAGDVASFLEEMNEYADELGLTESSFGDITGIDHINQYATPRDMAQIMRKALEVKTVKEILAKNIYSCAPVGSEQSYTYEGSNTMLGEYEPLVMGKSALSWEEGYAFASYLQKSGYEYICVIFASNGPEEEEPSHFTDTETLVDWAMSSFSYRTIINKNEPIRQMEIDLAWNRDFITLIPKEPFAATIKNDLDTKTIERRITLYHEGIIDAPIEKDKVYGKLEIFIHLDEKIGEVELIASDSVEASNVLVFWRKAQGIIGSLWFKLGVGFLVVLFVVYTVISIVHNAKRKKNREKKLKKYR